MLLRTHTTAVSCNQKAENLLCAGAWASSVPANLSPTRLAHESDFLNLELGRSFLKAFAMTKPLVAICGATGVQGGSVINALLESGEYRLRGVTRKVTSDKAKALQAKGVEMVQANLVNKDDLKGAFENADIVYGVTNFWDPEVLKNPSLEAEQGKNIADVAKESKVQWLIWNSAPSCLKGSGGKTHSSQTF
ncbi:hypothetical protein NQZ79_g5295 [Umbelopsis isabellina]|nr:hypothetical protein NQZ79_g5295 [Umbelopsis isabellina]